MAGGEGVDRDDRAAIIPTAVVSARYSLSAFEAIRASAWVARRDRTQIAIGIVPKRAFSQGELAHVRGLIPGGVADRA